LGAGSGDGGTEQVLEALSDWAGFAGGNGLLAHLGDGQDFNGGAGKGVKPPAWSFALDRSCSAGPSRHRPRQLRIQYPGAMHHVMSRGNRRQERKCPPAHGHAAEGV